MNKVCIFVINFVSCFQCRDIEYPDLSFVAFVPRVLSILLVTCLCILHVTSLLDAFVSRALCNMCLLLFRSLRKAYFCCLRWFISLVVYLDICVSLFWLKFSFKARYQKAVGQKGKGDMKYSLSEKILYRSFLLNRFLAFYPFFVFCQISFIEIDEGKSSKI